MTEPAFFTTSRPRHHRRWRYLFALTGVLLVVFLVIESSGGRSTGAPAHRFSHAAAPVGGHPAAAIDGQSAAGGGASGEPPSKPALGVYAGPGAVTEAEDFASEVGGSVPYALEFVDGSSWQAIVDGSSVLAPWSGSSFQMILGVPMLPAQGGTLESGALGAYNANFEELAQNLVAAGHGSAILLLGWDPNLAGTPWSVASAAQAAQYVTYWRQIVETMRQVPGTSFTFVWDATSSDAPLPGAASPVGATEAGGVTPMSLYPGNGYVGEIATDAFDQTSGVAQSSRWSMLAAVPYGPDWYAAFASSQGKPFMIAKWGLVPSTVAGGGGDDPAFVQSLLSWCATHGVTVATTWDYGSWAVGAVFPRSLGAVQSAVRAGVVS